MRGEPEPGSVIELRMAIEERVALGRVERKCAGCGRDWDGDVPRGAVMTLGRRGGVCSHCGSAEFTERDVRPALMEITGAGITQVAEKPKAKVSATADDLSTLRALQPALLDVENNLLNADQHLHRLVTESDENAAFFGHLQGAVHHLTDATTGNFDVGFSSRPVLGPVRALIAAVERLLARYDAEAHRAKASATTDDLLALSSLQAALLDVQNPLLAADQCLHRLVNVNEANLETFGLLQVGVHLMVDALIGDFDVTTLPFGLALLGPCRSLRTEIERVIARYEEERTKK